jgi:glycosyltransferase involved in cell wall biosynthesis
MTSSGPRRARNVLFIENSIGVSGSLISLCTLLAHLDGERYAPHVVLSRASQLEYFQRVLGSDIRAKLVLWTNSLKSVQPITSLLDFTMRHPRLPLRLLTSPVALLDIPTVILPYVARLYRLARQADVELIHHNNGLDVRAVVLAKLLGVPLVAYQRGDEYQSPTVRYLSRFVDTYIANSEATRRNLLKLGVPPDRVTTLYPPVDLERFDPTADASRQRTELGLGDRDLCFGIFGSLLKWKGHDVFLKAARLVVEAVPEARAVIIGEAPDGSTGYREELLGLARDLGIAQRTVFTGFRRDVPEMLQVLDVVVHASVSPEPFGRVIAEGMAMGRPVVAAGAGGPLEIIEHGRTGLLVRPDDPEALASAIVTLLSDRVLARRLGESARVAAEARFSPEAHARSVEGIYERTLRGREPAASPASEASTPWRQHDER